MSSEEGQHKVRHKDSKAGKEEKKKSWDREGKKEREATSKSKKVVPDMKSFFQFTTAGSLKPHGCSVPCRTPRIHATSRPTSCPFSASRRHKPLSVSFLCSHPFHNCRATVKSPGLQLNQKHSLSPGVPISEARGKHHTPGIHVQTLDLGVSSVLDTLFLAKCTRRHCRASEHTAKKGATKRKAQA